VLVSATIFGRSKSLQGAQFPRSAIREQSDWPPFQHWLINHVVPPESHQAT
jgi:hypothetical protein